MSRERLFIDGDAIFDIPEAAYREAGIKRNGRDETKKPGPSLDDLFKGTKYAVQPVEHAEWREEDHPRDEDGKFTSAGGGGGESSSGGRFKYRSDVKPQLDPPPGKQPISMDGTYTDPVGVAFAPSGTLPGDKPEGWEQKRHWINHGYYTDGPNAGLPLPGDTERAFSKGNAADGLADYTDNPERALLHHQVLSEFFNDVPDVPEGTQPTAILTMGGPASGKSSMLRSDGVDTSQYVWVDPDEIKSRLPEYRQALNQGELNGMTVSAADAAAMAHEESSTLSKRLTVLAMASKKNVIIDGTGTKIEKMVTMMRDLKATGYRVQLMMPDISEQEAQKRAAFREEDQGRHVPSFAITDSYSKVPFNFEPIAKEADEFALFDGTRKGHVVWSGKDGVETVHDPEYYAKFRYRTRSREGA